MRIGLIAWHEGQETDFAGIARRTGDSRVVMVRAGDAALLEPGDVAVSTREIAGLRCGRVYCGRDMGKLSECARMASAGVAVPRTVAITPGLRLAERDWGDRVVVKPDHGRLGRGLTVERTADVEWRDPLSWPAADPRHGQTMIAQAFIDTGTPVRATRALTFFGRVLYAVEITAVDPRQVAAMSADQTWRRDDDPKIDALAADVYRAMPEVPAHALDILRDGSGKLHVCEMNARGLAWHLSSPRGLARQQALGFDLYAAFDPLGRAAEAIRETFPC